MLRYISRRSSRWSDEIEAFDPESQSTEILEILTTRVFPLDILISLELAQLRTFTIPTISALLHKTRQYEEDGERRIDDTKAILTELTEEGLNSERSKAMMAHLNKIHSFYEISNDDYLYTLSTFIFEPILWMRDYAWRELSVKEKGAFYYFFRDMGQGMKIKDIPASLEDFWQWRLKYEARCQLYADSNKKVSFGLLNAFEKRIPKLFRPLIVPALASVIGDDRIRAVLGLPKPGLFSRSLVLLAMKIRQRLLRYVTVWDKLDWRSTRIYNDYPTYPEGFQVDELGPAHLVQKIKRAEAPVADTSAATDL
jgi:hypothetical protein